MQLVAPHATNTNMVKIVINTTCTVETLVAMMPKWAASITRQGTVMHCNASFQQQFGAGAGDYWLAKIHDTTGRLHKTFLAAMESKRHAGVEVTLQNKNGAPSPVWCEFYPVQADLCIIALHSTRYMRQVELAYMHRIRKYPDDNLWVVDDSGVIIWCRVGAGDPRKNTALGQHAAHLVKEKDRPAMLGALRTAKARQGKITTLVALPIGATRQAEMDIVHMPAGMYGARYYVASRHNVPRGTGIVARMLEAFGVKTYTALAEKLHVDKSSISRAAGENDAPAEMLMDCHNATGVSLDWLVSGKGQKELWMEGE